MSDDPVVTVLRHGLPESDGTYIVKKEGSTFNWFGPVELWMSRIPEKAPGEAK